MIEIRKPEKKSIVVIRAASGHELSNYEKYKLANIEPNAQENKIEIINVNGQRLQINEKAVNIELGDLALKDAITPENFSTNDLFIIKCTLDEAALKGDN